MKKIIPTLLALAASICVAPGQAHACIDSTHQRFVFFNRPPPSLPKGLLLLKVRVIGTLDKADVEILKPVDGLRGVTTMRVDPGPWNSCSVWGQTAGPVYVIGFLQRDVGGTIEFRALQLHANRLRPHLPRVDYGQYLVR